MVRPESRGIGAELLVGMIGQHEPRACMGTGFAQRVIPELPGERRAHGQPAKALNAALALLKVERARA